MGDCGSRGTRADQGVRPIYACAVARFHANPCWRTGQEHLKDHVGQVANLQRVANPPSGS